MKKSGILLPVIALICVTIIGGVALRILVSDWNTESRTRIIMLIAVVLLMAHGWYRALVHIRLGTSVDEVDEVEDEVEHAQSVKAVIGAFFNPMKMRFRTSLSIFILVLAYLFATPFIFWALLILLIALKGYLLYQLIRYHKAIKELAQLSAEQTADKVEFDEDKVSPWNCSSPLLVTPSISRLLTTVTPHCQPVAPNMADGLMWPMISSGHTTTVAAPCHCCCKSIALTSHPSTTRAYCPQADTCISSTNSARWIGTARITMSEFSITACLHHNCNPLISRRILPMNTS